MLMYFSILHSCSPGEYEVSVLVSNAVSERHARLRVFPLESPCNKPDITIINTDVRVSRMSAVLAELSYTTTSYLILFLFLLSII